MQLIFPDPLGSLNPLRRARRACRARRTVERHAAPARTGSGPGRAGGFAGTAHAAAARRRQGTGPARREPVTHKDSPLRQESTP
ncbi:hypothetical protein [Streptomyces sp. CBMA29]|uniref:hypothetical protein n=1 Tax=Streptomyces sp. CBMA29 TaxID=1896314 RepID=UPI001661AF4F|nr:hypothetical protein [Streptomyces sp. CBMA29]